MSTLHSASLFFVFAEVVYFVPAGDGTGFMEFFSQLLMVSLNHGWLRAFPPPPDSHSRFNMLLCGIILSTVSVER